jgi:hypothetical protein
MLVVFDRFNLCFKEGVMNKVQLQQKIARLEFAHDQLETELTYVDTLLKSVGFPRGLASAKEVALELLEEAEQASQTDNDKEN